MPPVYVLILCPTRELASQIAAEARALLKYHDGIGVQTLVGGARFKDDQKRLESESCEVSLNMHVPNFFLSKVSFFEIGYLCSVKIDGCTYIDIP